jgi:hypothetical protein
LWGLPLGDPSAHRDAGYIISLFRGPPQHRLSMEV